MNGHDRMWREFHASERANTGDESRRALSPGERQGLESGSLKFMGALRRSEPAGQELIDVSEQVSEHALLRVFAWQRERGIRHHNVRWARVVAHVVELPSEDPLAQDFQIEGRIVFCPWLRFQVDGCRYGL